MMQDNDLISRAAAIFVSDSADYRGLTVEDVMKVTDVVSAGLRDLPAVDAAPVIHAHWIEYYTDIMCSYCHATYKDEIVGMYQDGVDHLRYVGLEYCPHCGSIMDGGDE